MGGITIALGGAEPRRKSARDAKSVCRQIDSQPVEIETEAKMNGPVDSWGKYEGSEDGQTLTFPDDEQLIVLDRSESYQVGI